jgi:hypothetical protein
MYVGPSPKASTVNTVPVTSSPSPRFPLPITPPDLPLASRGLAPPLRRAPPTAEAASLSIGRGQPPSLGLLLLLSRCRHRDAAAFTLPPTAAGLSKVCTRYAFSAQVPRWYSVLEIGGFQHEIVVLFFFWKGIVVLLISVCQVSMPSPCKDTLHRHRAWQSEFWLPSNSYRRVLYSFSCLPSVGHWSWVGHSCLIWAQSRKSVIWFSFSKCTKMMSISGFFFLYYDFVREEQNVLEFLEANRAW